MRNESMPAGTAAILGERAVATRIAAPASAARCRWCVKAPPASRTNSPVSKARIAARGFATRSMGAVNRCRSPLHGVRRRGQSTSRKNFSIVGIALSRPGT